MDINGYLDLVPTENARRPKFMQFLESILTPVMDLHGIATNMNAYAVDTAAGFQLDTIGMLVSVSRRLPYLPPSGDMNMSDDVYRIILKMRIAQEMWDGGNKNAAEIYRDAIGDFANIRYQDNLDSSVTVTIEAEQAEAAQIIYSNQEVLVPAGIQRTIDVEISGIEITTYNALAVSSQEFDNTIHLTRRS